MKPNEGTEPVEATESAAAPMFTMVSSADDAPTCDLDGNCA